MVTTLMDSKFGLPLLLLYALCTGADGRLRRGDGDELAECSCDCCNTVRRLPDESEPGVAVKCAPSHVHDSEVCTNECQTPNGDRLLSSRSNVLDYQRYCFYECKPANGPKSPPATQCIPLDFQDIQKTADHGHAKDPAIIYQEFYKRASLVAAATTAAKEPSTKEAKMEALKGLKQSMAEGKEAWHEAKVTRGIEAGTAQNMNEMLRAHYAHVEEIEKQIAAGHKGHKKAPEPPQFGVVDPFAGIHDIRDMAVHAGEAAEGAGEAAQAALAALKQARQLGWEGAVGVQENHMKGVVAQAAAKAKADAAMLAKISNTAEQKMAAAAAKAAEPFFISMIRAQQTAKDYTRRGEEQATLARKLQAESEKLAFSANVLNAKGKVAVAQAKILDARKEMREAQSYAKQARHFFAVAKEVEKGIPKFVAAAQAASAKAAFDVNPAMMAGTKG